MTHEQHQPESDWMRTLVDAHAADLTRYAASILGDAEAAKDVVQDSFLQLWKQPGDTPDRDIRPWLFRVCRNRAIDQKRKARRMRPLDETFTREADVEQPGPQSAAEREDRHAHIVRLMDGLPENQKEVVRLKFQNGMSYKEIASVTELSVSNVGFLLHTALHTLRTWALATGE